MSLQPETVAATAPAAGVGAVLGESDITRLRDALKRCSPATFEAACAYRRTGNPDCVPVVIVGMIERYVHRDVRSKLQSDPDRLRLVEDLSIDSLTLLEIVFLAEEVLRLTVDNEELRPLHTVGDIKAFIALKLRRSDAAADGFSGAAPQGAG